MKIHTGEDRHECPECKKVKPIFSTDFVVDSYVFFKIYLSKKGLKDHLKRMHTTDDKTVFNCEHCGNVRRE